jgi:hypothetical protein
MMARSNDNRVSRIPYFASGPVSGELWLPPLAEVALQLRW